MRRHTSKHRAIQFTIPLVFPLIIILTIIVCGCTKEEPSKPINPTGGTVVKDLDNEKDYTNIEYSSYLTDKLYDDINGNVLFSPLSLNMALGMASEGANGDTKTLLSKYLDTDNYGDIANAYLKEVDNLVENGDKYYKKYDSEYANVFEIANSVWVNSNYKLKDNFKSIMKTKYKAEVANIDVTKPNEEANRINSWVSNKTREMIPSIISENSINESTNSILINTVYFENPWNEPWDLMNKTEKFIGFDKSEDITYMVTGADSYFENEYATAFGYNYTNGLEFIGILPKEKGEFTIQSLNIQSLLENRSYKYDIINAKMPELNIETTNNIIKNSLEEIGYNNIFNEETADFRDIAELKENENIFISGIIQKCKLELDDKGTKAAAATAVQFDMIASITEPKKLKETNVYLDRPFAFLIYDSENEQILFIGKVITVEK